MWQKLIAASTENAVVVALWGAVAEEALTDEVLECCGRPAEAYQTVVPA
jgi:hypothetical protein